MDFVIRFNYFQVKGGAARASLGSKTDLWFLSEMKTPVAKEFDRSKKPKQYVVPVSIPARKVGVAVGRGNGSGKGKGWGGEAGGGAGEALERSRVVTRNVHRRPPRVGRVTFVSLMAPQRTSSLFPSPPRPPLIEHRVSRTAPHSSSFVTYRVHRVHWRVLHRTIRSAARRRRRSAASPRRGRPLVRVSVRLNKALT